MPSPSAVPLALCLLTACGGSAHTAPTPPDGDGAPRGLRLLTTPDGPPHYELRWDPARGDASPGPYAVFAGDQPVTAQRLRGAERFEAGSTTGMRLVLPADTGALHLAVRDEETTRLSDSLRVETDRRIGYAAVDEVGEIDLWEGPAGGVAVRLTRSANISQMVWSPTGTDIALLGGGTFTLHAQSRRAAVLEPAVAIADAAFAPRWSPDGTRLAFLAGDPPSQRGALHIARWNGTLLGVDALPTDAAVTTLAWAPDGRQLAYLTDGEAGAQLYVIDVASGASDRVSRPIKPFAHVVAFAWSPRAATLAYVTEHPDASGHDLFVADLATEQWTLLTTDVAPEVPLAWAPDGSALGFVRRNAAGKRVLHIGSPDVAPRALTGDDLDVADFRWSPRASDAIALRARSGRGLQAFLVHTDGGLALRFSHFLGPGENVLSIGWSPNGQHVAYVATGVTSQSLFTASEDGSRLARVSEGFVGFPFRDANGTPQLTPDAFRWSPDGEELAYARFRRIDERTELFLTPAAGGGAVLMTGAPPGHGSILDAAWSRLGWRPSPGFVSPRALAGR